MNSTQEFTKQEIQRGVVRFPVRYQRFLNRVKPEVSTCAIDDTMLFILGEGLDEFSLFAEWELSPLEHTWLSFYVFSDEMDFPHARNAMEAVQDNQYDFKLDLSEYGPMELYITLNTQRVDVKAVEAVIRQVCEENDIVYCNPPGFEMD